MTTTVAFRRAGDGVYEAENGEVVVRKVDPEAQAAGYSGWHLFVCGDWWQTYATKREAVEAYREWRENV